MSTFQQVCSVILLQIIHRFIIALSLTFVLWKKTGFFSVEEDSLGSGAESSGVSGDKACPSPHP